MTTVNFNVSPVKPWRLGRKQLLVNFLVFFGSIAITPILLNVTPLSGKLGGAFIFVTVATLGNIFLSVLRQGPRMISEAVSSSLIYLATALVLLPLGSILFTVIQKGVGAIRWNTFTQDMRLTQPDASYTEGGALHAIVGTALLVLIATIISVPIGTLTALYLTEIKGRFEGLVRFLVQAMSGVPSIVAGLFIYSVLIVNLGAKYSAFAGALALTILMLPTVARTAEEVLKLIPRELREAGTALGATQWRTVAMVVVPAARSGILTAVILGVARVAGETAPLLLTILGNTATNINPFSGPSAALPLYTFTLLRTGLDVAISRAWGGALILLTLVLILFIAARLLSGKKR
jgi:phosphate transport system permease protein